MKTVIRLLVNSFLLSLLFVFCLQQNITSKKFQNELVFDTLTTCCDKAIPLENEMLGDLVCKNGGAFPDEWKDISFNNQDL